MPVRGGEAFQVDAAIDDLQPLGVCPQVEIEAAVVLRDANDEARPPDLAHKPHAMHEQIVGMAGEAEGDAQQFGRVHGHGRGRVGPMGVDVANRLLSPKHRQADGRQQVEQQPQPLLESFGRAGKRARNGSKKAAAEYKWREKQFKRHANPAKRIEVLDPAR